MALSSYERWTHVYVKVELTLLKPLDIRATISLRVEAVHCLCAGRQRSKVHVRRMIVPRTQGKGRTAIPYIKKRSFRFSFCASATRIYTCVSSIPSNATCSGQEFSVGLALGPCTSSLTDLTSAMNRTQACLPAIGYTTTSPRRICLTNLSGQRVSEVYVFHVYPTRRQGQPRRTPRYPLPTSQTNPLRRPRKEKMTPETSASRSLARSWTSA